jgi:UDP-glucose 4-epimerase
VSCCVIGGAGFIGTHVTRLLSESGRDVVILGRRTELGMRLSPRVRYVSGDYGNRADLRNALDGVDEVVHLAFATVPQTSYEDPVFDVLSNLPASVQLCQEAVSAGIAKILLVSSGGTVYGKTDSLPITEDHPTNPISPYGITKLTVEKFALMFHETSGLPMVVVRPANAYGEEQQAHGGQGFIAAAMHSILRGDEVTIFGPEGTIRDYIHVSDVASGIVAALECGDDGDTYNIGAGVGRNNLEVLSEIEPLASRAGLRLLTRTLTPRAYDVPANVLDSSKLHAVSGWEPKVGFAAGIERVWNAVLSSQRT